MSQDRSESQKSPAREARERRLAAALRANLRRRKAVTVEETADPPVSAPEIGRDGPPDHD